MVFQLTRHAQFAMARRRISGETANRILEAPEQVVPEREGLVAYQSRLATDDIGTVLVRVIVEERASPTGS